MADECWKLENDLCRCCLTEGSHKNLGSSYHNSATGDDEVYADMLLSNIGLNINPVKGLLSEVTYAICDNCVERLRDASNFKKQVQASEEKFWDLFSKNAFKATTPITVKIEEEDYTGGNCKSEDDDGCNPNEFSDEDTKMNLLEIKAETKKAKGKKPKAKPKPKAKKATKRKMAPRKTPAKVKTIKTEPDMDAEGTEGEGEETKKPKGTRTAKFRLEEADYATEGDEYVCKRCEKRYDKMCSLKFHIKSKHYKIPRFICPVCQKEFMTPAPLTVHKLEAHNIDERHHCNACRGAFNTKVQLRKHINNFHMLGERYKCEFCEYESFSFEGMYKHKFKHKTVKDYHCRFCRKAFLRKTTLDLHERIHTGDRRKVCTVCGQAFVQKASLNYHMAKYHPEVNF